MGEQFLIIVGHLTSILQMLIFKMEMDLKLEDGENLQQLKIYMVHLVEKILLFISLKIVLLLQTKQMDSIVIISQDKQLFGTIIKLIEIKQILI